MRTQSTCRAVLLAAVALLAVAGDIRADAVYQPNKPRYDGTILSISAGKGMALRWSVTKATRWFSLNEIQRIELTGAKDFNEAEQLLLAGEFKKAISGYERDKLRSHKPWFKQYINARLVRCFAETKQFSRAVRTYIELCQSGSAMLPYVELPAPMPKGSADNDAALKAIEGTLAANAKIAGADKLKELRLNIRLLQGSPSEVLEEIVKQLDSSNPDHRARMRLKHIELLLILDKIDEAKQSLRVAREGLAEKYKPLDPKYQPDLIFFEGRILHAAKDYLHAALKFMRIPAHYSRTKKVLAAESLYWAAKSMHEAQDVPLPEVAAPLQEAIQKFPGTGGARKAQEMLDKLKGSGK
jgi:hypothetical protein